MIKTVEIRGQKVKVDEGYLDLIPVEGLQMNRCSLQNMTFFQLQIWDTAGQERFRSITQSYYRSANALILTYDITCEDSFRCLPEWLREIEQYANNQVVTILVGKKLDFALCCSPAGFRRTFWFDKCYSICMESDSTGDFCSILLLINYNSHRCSTYSFTPNLTSHYVKS